MECTEGLRRLRFGSYQHEVPRYKWFGKSTCEAVLRSSLVLARESQPVGMHVGVSCLGHPKLNKSLGTTRSTPQAGPRMGGSGVVGFRVFGHGLGFACNFKAA